MHENDSTMATGLTLPGSGNGIYTITHPDHDVDLTVIASSLTEACEIAADYCDESDKVGEYYGAERVQAGRRWVAFDSRADAENQCADLLARGVDFGLICTRVTYSGPFGSSAPTPMWWEVGTTDREWCRLEAGVLCGGDQ